MSPSESLITGSAIITVSEKYTLFVVLFPDGRAIAGYAVWKDGDTNNEAVATRIAAGRATADYRKRPEKKDYVSMEIRFPRIRIKN